MIKKKYTLTGINNKVMYSVANQVLKDKKKAKLNQRKKKLENIEEGY